MKFSFYAFDTISIQEMVARAILAEELNFDYFWIPDEVPATKYRDPFVGLSAVGWNTRKIKIGTNITNPYTRHPALIATAFNSLYEITGGRVSIGISVGGEMPFKPLKIPMWKHPLTTLSEAITIMRKMFDGEVVTFEGKIFSVENLKLLPVPDRKIPIFVGARGPKMVQLAGRLADGVLSSVPIPKIPYLIEMVKKGAAKGNRDLTDFLFSNAIPFSISKNRDIAYKLVKPAIAGLITFLSDFLVLESGVTKERMNKIRTAFRKKDTDAFQELITDEIVQNFSISGTAKDVISKIREIRDLGINNVVVQPPFGETIEYAMRTTAIEIMPNFRR